MRRLATTGTSALALVAVALAAAAADEIPMLRFDPFAPPVLAGLPGRSEGPASLAGPAWTPVLTGVVVAGARSVANLNGVVVGIGEEAHGYRLLRVREGEAVFEREGREIVLSLLPNPAPTAEDEP